MKIALAAREYERPLLEELGSRLVTSLDKKYDRLVEYKGADPVWAQNVWLETERFEFESISQAAKHLRAIQRNWFLHSTAAHRRAQLIQEALPPLKVKPLDFMSPVPKAPLGSWTLLDEKTMLYSAKCSSPYPDGEVPFNENKTEPPSRAYLKLWEWFTIHGMAPKPGETVIDMGSCPGGWTWVLDQLGANVISVDKAPLSKDAKFSKRVKEINESAFGLEPKDIGKVDWFFSDIICYPERLYDLVEKWKDTATNFVCTIKFQGPTNHEIIPKFLELEGSKIQHLYHNKHELTFSWIRKA